ncbi:hypothetical protein [Promicromonospora sp. NPDC090134]|uniref:hypothetical protein n=1 Tax=Promicromonospora sp. NPDC090134 TaxID=3364408 RepID=UPI00383060EC
MRRTTATALTAAGLTLTALTSACTTTDPEPAQSSTTRQTPGDEPAAYRDGQYEATGWYGGLPSSITVDLSLRDGVITDVEVTPHAEDETSLDLQERFAEAVPDVVVGRSIDEVELDRLAGSSGTTQGFNDAIDQIREEAAAG